MKREILARVDIASYIGGSVQLHKRGKDLVGLCPFHLEKTPSFHVHPDSGYYKCFGCGEGGDLFTFVMKHEGVPFPEAVAILAKRAGVEIEPEDPRAARARNERSAIYEANALAVAYFERMLQSDGAANARAYCERRGLSAATIERFHLGYAPPQWDGLANELQRHGVDADLAAKAGLVKPGQRGYYDFYRDRLMVPTYATTGEVIAFGGRAIGDGEPKYLNSPTTPVYTKGRHLFALNLARRAAGLDGNLIVVEGYLDCIALHQAGFENAVAALGTAFTEQQANELRKYAQHIFLCYDGDAAGTAAAGKAIEIAANVLEDAGSSVRIVLMPPGEDPDSFVRTHGADAFRERLNDAKASIEFRLEGEVARLQTGFASPASIAQEAEALIRRMTPVAEWDRWRVWIARRLHINENDLRTSRFLSNRANFAPRTASVAPRVSRHVAATVAPLSFEAEVLSIVLEEPPLAAEYADCIPAGSFRDPQYRRIYERILEHASSLEQPADVFALFTEDSDSVGLLTTIGRRDRSSTVRYEDAAQRRSHLDRVVERLQLEADRMRYQELSRRIDETMMAGAPIADELRREFDELVSRLKK
ncbi:MAG: DNA primase [Candidatus Eremiobacteraeota bacterium]|nr:DNA primase [Candidatus Eremiobacteraeota bacterium]